MEEYIPFLLQLQTQTQVWHWQTNKYAAHVALGDYYGKIQELSDKFIEVTKGKNPSGAEPSLRETTFEVKGIVNIDIAAQYALWAQQMLEIANGEEMVSKLDVQDIFLDMINETHKLVYLLRLS